MNRDQKAAFVENVAERVQESEAIFAVDYRGISVPQVAELRSKLGEAGASFQVVKNTLTRLALDKADSAGKAGTIDLKEFLEGPTAFTYVKGDVALAVKAIANFTKEYELLEFKGGMMDGQVVTIDQFKALTRLPSRDVLNGQLVGIIATPITGVVRTLNALISGLAIQLGQIAEKGLVTGEAPPAATSAPADEPAPDPAPEQEPAPPEAPSTEDTAASATDDAPTDEDESSQPEPTAEAEAPDDPSNSARASDEDGAPSPDGDGSSSDAAPDSDESPDASTEND